MAAISNSSPLILFARTGRLDLLREVFTEILIPSAVRDEVVGEGTGRPGAAEVAGASWIKTKPLASLDIARALLTELQRGEAEAIALAGELGGQMHILLDDRKARQFARRRGLRVLGSGGALVLAKEQGALPLLRPVLDELRSAGLRLSDSVYYQLLAIADERPAADYPM
ncbi:MAG: DUF3368 domain-containing protein [Chloroflexi bacterium]|nr:DUF3368 domain-containing protein [Chloroflexota bacterium]